jgi:hypothetical protein
VFTPEGFKTRIEALTSLIRFGPALLPAAEFLVLLFHAERALTYGKKSDAASLSQMTDGVRTKGGIWIRGGAGVNKSTAAAANAQLEARGLLKRTQKDSMRRGHGATEYEVRWANVAKLLEKCGSGDTLVRLTDKPLSDKQTSPCPAEGQALSDKRTHRGVYTEGFHHQRGKKQRPETFVEGSTGSATPDEKPEPLDFKKSDDEKPKPRTPLENPEMEFSARMAERHGPTVDAAALLGQVKGELGEIPLTRFLETDLTATTAPEKLTNPAGHYRKLARKLGRAAGVSVLETIAETSAAARKFLMSENTRHSKPTCCDDGRLTAGGYCSCRTGAARRELDAMQNRAVPPVETSGPALAAATEAAAR